MILNGFGYQIAHGVLVTIAVSVSALMFGLSLSIIFTWLSFSVHTGMRRLILGLTSVIRGLPELLVLFAMYFGGTALLTALFHQSIQVNAFFAGVIALGLIFSAYATQTWRGAFLAIPVGQAEAGESLGLSRLLIFKNILLPQAWRHALPGLGNLWLVLLKDSALVALIGLGDLMNQSQVAASSTQQPFKFYITAAVLFLILTSFSQWLLNRFYHHDQRSTVSVL